MGKQIEDVQIAVGGGGAAGSAIVSLLLAAGARDIVVWDREGILYRDDAALSPAKHSLAERTNPRRLRGDLRDALTGADVFIGVSAAERPGGRVDRRDGRARRSSSRWPTPTPRSTPPRPGSTRRSWPPGGSDYPNQINNVLAFPGVFRGLLDARATQVTDRHAHRGRRTPWPPVVTDDELNANYIVPSVFAPDIVKTVAAAISSRD